MKDLGMFAPLDWLILGLTTSIVLYMYISRHRNYWKNQNVPYEPFSLLRSLRTLSKPYHTVDMERCQKYGRLFGVYENSKPLLVLSDPDLVKRVLVKDFASLPERRRATFHDPLLDNMMSVATPECWKRVRPAASPAFSSGKLSKMSHLIEECSRATAVHLLNLAQDEKEIDIKKFFGSYALDVIARCAFGTQIDSYDDETNEFVQKARTAFSGSVTLRLVLSMLFPRAFKLLGIRGMNVDIFYFFKTLSLTIIKQRQETMTRREDFLQLMMDARQGSIFNSGENTESPTETLLDLNEERKRQDVTDSKGLTEDEALSQCVMFFFAGLETTSCTLALTAYLLALHADCQEKLRKEVDECMEKHGNRPPLEAVLNLQYLHGVVCETMRMFPIATRLERTCIEPYTLADTGVTVPKDCMIAVPVYAMHNDPEYFPDPSTFDPLRFSEENITSIRPYTYLPFGAGPRNCIGMRLALRTLKLCVMNAVHNVEFVRTAKTKVMQVLDLWYEAEVPKDCNVPFRFSEYVRGSSIISFLRVG